MPFCSFFFSKSSFWYDVFLVLTQAVTNDKPSAILFYFHQSLVHNMFRLAPWSHGILLTTEWKSHKSQKKTFVMTTFTLSHKVQCYQSQMEWEKVKNFHPSGVVFSPPSPPRFSLASVVLRPLLAELKTPPSLHPWCRGLELRTPPPPGKEELLALEDGHGDLVHDDVGWMGPPGKDELVAATSATATSFDTPLHNPTPRTGTKNKLVPCMNSSLLFILVSGSRCAILTP